jgi:serine/threonine protein kinase
MANTASGQAGGSKAPGTILGGRYRLGRLLGEGGMGAVYEASPIDRPQQPYALKLLHPDMAENPQVVERFLAEGDVCRRLDHPGILRVFDVGHEAGVPYLVMELLNGRALIDYTEHGQKLPTSFAVTVCAGVLHALDYAHARQIVHRDLKPENVYLVASEGGHYHTKLLDFGIARVIDAAGGRKRTATGVLLGTPGYMSPEQVKAARNVDHRADLWAVGVMFYEMVSGQPAFPSDGDDPNNIWGLISAVLTKDPLPLSSIDPALAAFDGFIAKALAKDIDHRYQSAREMSEDLLALGRGEQRPSMMAASPATPAGQPINSRGSLVAIPALAETALAPQSGGGTLPSSRDVAAAAQQAGAMGGTMPSGALAQAQAGAPAPASLAGTVPMSGPSSAQGSLAATAYAPPSPLTPAAAPPPARIPQSTSPSGFGPAPATASSPPVIAPRGADPEPKRPALLPWIALAVALLAALGGALAWALK